MFSDLDEIYLVLILFEKILFDKKKNDFGPSLLLIRRCLYVFQYCDVYETNGYKVEGAGEDSGGPLSFQFRSVARLTTDEKTQGAYQVLRRWNKCLENEGVCV